MPRFEPDRTGTIALVVLSLLLAVLGLVLMSQATAGVGIIAFGCLVAILARIAQAGRHHNELKELRREQSPFEQR
jgi:hypothetical protein